MSEPLRQFVQCDACGALVEEGTRECPSCGEPVAAAAAEPSPDETVSRAELFGRLFAGGDAESDDDEDGSTGG